MNSISFRLMAKNFKNRYKPENVARVLDEVEIREGDTILDFGCGPGGYTFGAALRVGKTGVVYALDKTRIAGKYIMKGAREHNLENIVFIHSSGETRLADESVDVVLLYDTFHMLKNKGMVLTELHRVLKTEGILSFSDHHMQEEKIMKAFEDSGLYHLLEKGDKTYEFRKK